MNSPRETPTADKSSPRLRPVLEPPRFSLATLMWVVAALGVLFGLMSAAGPIGGFALLLFVLAIIAHVAGNSIGTRLREFGSQKVEDADGQGKPSTRDDARRASAPASNLSLGGRISLTMIIFSAAGALVGGAGGSALLIWLAWSQLNVPTAIVAIVSPTVLGGWLGFALSSFTQTAGGAWFEASGSYRREKYVRRDSQTEHAGPTTADPGR